MKQEKDFKGYVIPDEYLPMIQGKSDSKIVIMQCPECGFTNLVATRNVGKIRCLCMDYNAKFIFMWSPGDL